MKTKKISELEVLENASETTNILVEEDGKAKKIPASTLDNGNVKTVNGATPDKNGNVEIEVGSKQVQVDWDQDDETQSDCILHRPGSVAIAKKEIVNGEYTLNDIGGGLAAAEILLSENMDTPAALNVTINGTAYEDIKGAVCAELGGYTAFGNLSLMNATWGSSYEDTGEPFIVTFIPAEATTVNAPVLSLLINGVDLTNNVSIVAITRYIRKLERAAVPPLYSIFYLGEDEYLYVDSGLSSKATRADVKTALDSEFVALRQVGIDGIKYPCFVTVRDDYAIVAVVTNWTVTDTQKQPLLSVYYSAEYTA